MNKKGFTLVELLATIVLLTLITLLTSFTINKIVNDSKKNSYKSMVDDILGAGITYVNDTESIKLADLDNLKIYLKTLANGGYIDNNIKDPMQDKELNLNSSYIIVSKQTSASAANNKTDYKFSGNYLYELKIVYK